MREFFDKVKHFFDEKKIPQFLGRISDVITDSIYQKHFCGSLCNYQFITQRTTEETQRTTEAKLY